MVGKIEIAMMRIHIGSFEYAIKNDTIEIKNIDCVDDGSLLKLFEGIPTNEPFLVDYVEDKFELIEEQGNMFLVKFKDGLFIEEKFGFLLYYLKTIGFDITNTMRLEKC